MNLLAGDLGGTKTILAVYSNENYPKKLFKKHYKSLEWKSFYSIFEDFIKHLPENISLPEYVCIGVAGPINGQKVKITNLGWDIDIEELSKLSKINNIELINDFSVLIYGIPFFKKSQYEVIQGTLNTEYKTNQKLVAIIGAGTGLGMSRGLITPTNIFIFPSEGGHREFSPRTENEWELIKWLKIKLNIQRVSIERIVSGTGLGMIARWKLDDPINENHPLQKTLKKIDNDKSAFTDLPALVWEKATNGDKLMSEALRIWLNAYGSAAGDLALQELCTSGLWISGGTAAKNLDGINSSNFLNAFSNKGRFQSYLKEIPLIVLKDPEATLFSSACRARLSAESNGRLS
ncbi:glucokinase [Prochlorococcus marinus]|uniref:glucokinase n=1 Tax=Prochlorococcus marinus TaxID=1219 RepID=UPI0022B2F73C|nr:glucokinase [Prochlorococcus marinus]